MFPPVSRPSLLRAIDAPKPWGWELWLTSTRPEGAARLPPDGARTLTDWVAAHPEVLGPWTRRIFGPTKPMFTKLIHTDFPSRVHLGFRRQVERGQLLAWLEEEQGQVRRLFAALQVGDEASFAIWHARYEAWATRQALLGWRREDDEVSARELAPFVASSFDLRGWLRTTRQNRAAIVDTLNEIDLAHESGNLFLSSAGIVHAIFGLSHQTHPLDGSRAALQALYGTLAESAKRGASDEDLALQIDAVELSALRAGNRAPPKNEAWLAATIDGAEVLVEPQQSSDTTYSLADFYTPLTWGPGGVRFRKGAPESGLSREQLAGYLGDVDFAVTPVASMRRRPEGVAQASAARAWELLRLVDEPTTWPFFTAYQLELRGAFTASPPPGVFQEIAVTRGRVELRDGHGVLGELGTRAPAFIPATLDGPFTLTAREPATVMLFSVPGARGGAPRPV